MYMQGGFEFDLAQAPLGKTGFKIILAWWPGHMFLMSFWSFQRHTAQNKILVHDNDGI